MGSYSDRLAALVVTARSRDGSVNARLNPVDGITVGFDEQALRRHNESSLATQIEIAVSGVLAGGERAVGLIREKIDGEADSKQLAETSTGRLMLRYNAALAEIGGTGESPDGSVGVTLRGTSKVAVRIRPRTVNYLDTEQLSTQVDAAIGAARKSHTEAAIEVYREVFDLVRR